MQITYASPNRPIHYHYAQAFARAGLLKAFVSGFPRFSPRAGLPELGDRMIRRDHLQCLYLASLRWPLLPEAASEWLAWASKAWLDRCSARFAAESDLFLFYNGCGLESARRLRHSGVIRVVEVVNSHVLQQDEILREEHRIAGVRYDGIYPREIATRTAEYEEVDYILCPSEFVRQSFLTRGFSPERIIKNTFGFEQPAAEPEAKRDDGVFRVLYVGSLSVRKGLRYLIEAFNQFEHPRKELVLVGPDARPTGLENLTLPDSVRRTGVLKGSALASAYASASAFVLPSVEEGLALVMAEALSYGLPVIATANTGAEDLFLNGKEGFVVPIRSSKAIAEGLQQLADDPDLRRRMSHAARQRAAELAGWRVSGQRLTGQLCRLVHPLRETDLFSNRRQNGRI
jgi:alpha-maltose-1-phosphate synthase